jgi:Rrf2 family transcriptional regulator, cysteine metabolism repressor
MLKLSTKGRYGTRLMVVLALNYDKGQVLLKDIAAQEDLSEGYLENIVPLLKSAGLIYAIRGARGGYALAKKPAEISLRQIIQALEGPLNYVECVGNPSICKRLDECAVRDFWSEINQTMINALDNVTLENIVEKHKQRGR